MKKSLFIICIFSFHFLSFAQQQKLESLKNAIAKIHQKPIDTTQVRLLSAIGYDMREIDSTLSKKLIKEALSKSIMLKNKALFN
jgi:hypothetical protein